MATKEIVFISKYPGHEIVRRCHIEKPIGFTGKEWVTAENGEPVRYQFEPGVDKESGKLVGILKVREGQDKLDTDGPGWLKPGEEFGVVRDAPAALRVHRAFGDDFWEFGHAPGTQYPRPIEFRKDVRLAIAKLNEEALVEMIRAEKASHDRQDLLTEAQDALELVRSELAAAHAAAEAEASKKPAAKQKAAA